MHPTVTKLIMLIDELTLLEPELDMLDRAQLTGPERRLVEAVTEGCDALVPPSDMHLAAIHRLRVFDPPPKKNKATRQNEDRPSKVDQKFLAELAPVLERSGPLNIAAIQEALGCTSKRVSSRGRALADHGLLLSRRSFGGVFYALPGQETELARLVEESNAQGAASLLGARDDAQKPTRDAHLEAVLRGMLKAGKMPAKLVHIQEWSGLDVAADGLVALLNELLEEGLVRQAKGERWALTSKGLSLAQEG